MEIKENGHRFSTYYKWETRKHTPYDYAQNGLLNKLLSRTIVETTNPFLQFILKYVDYSIIYMFKSADVLKNFKNYNWKNR